MYGNNEIYYYMTQVNSYLRAQETQIKKMEEEIKNLQKQLKSLKDNQTNHIEKIEYKFDQLKIERLEGTLNIGLAPQGMGDSEAFENFSVPQNPAANLPILQQFPDLYPRIKEEIGQFLTNECQQHIDERAANYNINLIDSYRSFIIQDIERQLDGRLHYYLNQASLNDLRNTSQEEIIQYITAEIKRDIVNAIDAFIKNLPMGGNYS